MVEEKKEGEREPKAAPKNAAALTRAEEYGANTVHIQNYLLITTRLTSGKVWILVLQGDRSNRKGSKKLDRFAIRVRALPDFSLTQTRFILSIDASRPIQS